MRVVLTCFALALFAGAGLQSRADDGPKAGVKPHPDAHKNHVSRASSEYLGWSRRFECYHDYDTAAELARETGRPMFVIFCRAGEITDPRTGKPKCAS